MIGRISIARLHILGFLYNGIKSAVEPMNSAAGFISKVFFTFLTK